MIDIREYAKQVDEGERLSKALHLAQIERDKLLDLLEYGMTIICNAGGGDWTKESKDWQEAARKWVDQYGPLVGPLSASKARKSDGESPDGLRTDLYANV